MVTKSKTTPRKKRANKKPTFADRIFKPAQNLYYKCLIFGPSRSGKTTFASTAGYDEGRASPALLLDFEGGSGSAAGIPDLYVSPMRDWVDFNEACEYLTSDANKFKTVIIDSVSELHIFSLLNIIDYELATNPKRSERGDENTAEQSDYGKSLVQMRRFLRVLRELPLHTIVTSLSKADDYPREGKVRVPAMFGQLAGEMVGMFPIVGYLINERTRQKRKAIFNRVLHLQNTEGVRNGVRIPVGSKFPNLLSEPTVPKLFDLLDLVYKD